MSVTMRDLTPRTKKQSLKTVAGAGNLHTMNDMQLLAYFGKHARRYPDLPGGPGYAIHFGGTTLESPDTKTLFEKFKEAVRNYGKNVSGTKAGK